jgi:hypothetical protein
MRKSAKKSPSSAQLREKVLQNCLLDIKSKRSAVVQQCRMQSIESRAEFAKAYLNQMFKDEGSQQNDSSDMREEEDEELLNLISDAIEFELENRNADEEMPYQEDFTDSQLCEMFEENADDSIICPLCRYEVFLPFSIRLCFTGSNSLFTRQNRNSMLVISEQWGNASCQCGAMINLARQSCETSESMVNESTVTDERSIRTNHMSANELKQRLASAHER